MHEINYASIHERLQRFLPGEYVSLNEFKRRSGELLEQVGGLEKFVEKRGKLECIGWNGKQKLTRVRGLDFVRGLASHSYLPLAFPRFKLGHKNYGRTIEETFLPAVARSCAADGREFFNHRAGTLAGKVRLFAESRQSQFIEAMAKQPLVGLWYPKVAMGFNALNDCDYVSKLRLPIKCCISGVIDTAAALVAAPDALKDLNIPDDRDGWGGRCNPYDCVNAWQDSHHHLYFIIDDEDVVGFGRYDLVWQNFPRSLLVYK